MDSNTRAIAEVLRRRHERESNVIRFPTPSERMRRESDRWLRRWTRPFDDNTPPSAD